MTRLEFLHQRMGVCLKHDLLSLRTTQCLCPIWLLQMPVHEKASMTRSCELEDMQEVPVQTAGPSGTSGSGEHLQPLCDCTRDSQLSALVACMLEAPDCSHDPLS
jgi:hypothetical protein